MDTSSPIVPRRTTLTNCVAEFVETRGRAAMLSPQEVPAEEIEDIKNPNDFTIDYVLQIISKIREVRDGRHVKTCKAFIRKCYRKVEDHQGVIQAIQTMVPSDLLIASIPPTECTNKAVEKHCEHRQAVQQFLSEIPTQLDRIKRLKEIHQISLRLHSLADSVLLSIFVVLERIVDDLTRSWKGQKKSQDLKGLVKSPLAALRNSDNEKSVPHTLAEFQSHIDAFQTEVDMADIQMLFRVEQNIVELKKLMTIMREQIGIELKEGLQQSIKRIFQNSQHAPIVEEHNREELYRRCSPAFNAKTGQASVDRKALPSPPSTEQAPPSTIQRGESNQRVASKWLKKLKDFEHQPLTDIKGCLQHMELLGIDEKNISLQTPPTSLNNPLSFTSALLATALRSTSAYAVLAFFCMRRNNECIADQQSGPGGMVKNLNGQLLEFIAKNRPTVDLSPLRSEEFFSKSRKSLKDGLEMLKALFSLLPEGDIIFVVLDSLSCLSGEEDDGDQVIKILGRIVERSKHVVIKVLVSSPRVNSRVEKIADMSLHVQDLVCAQELFDVKEPRRDIAAGQIGFKKKKKGRIEEESDGDEDDTEVDTEEPECEDRDSEDDGQPSSSSSIKRVDSFNLRFNEMCTW
ncbi:hypothetical protein B0H63DRAFT_534533 [Podospora didyma]|uniref:Uncharacterized protein n=1 Tax=Podospora didyma TaxID=330526 RepID=A0AAE0K1R6_9PEZI|nr:hypothetical protein B0H63DRAFT_534533 [Podospora didyma]